MCSGAQFSREYGVDLGGRGGPEPGPKVRATVCQSRSIGVFPSSRKLCPPVDVRSSRCQASGPHSTFPRCGMEGCTIDTRMLSPQHTPRSARGSLANTVCGTVAARSHSCSCGRVKHLGVLTTKACATTYQNQRMNYWCAGQPEPRHDISPSSVLGF